MANRVGSYVSKGYHSAPQTELCCFFFHILGERKHILPQDSKSSIDLCKQSSDMRIQFQVTTPRYLMISTFSRTHSVGRDVTKIAPVRFLCQN